MSRGRRYENEPKLNMKKVFGVAIAFAVLIMVIFSIVKLIKNHKDASNLSTTAYFTALDNGKWGVINNQGNIVIEPTYDEMIVIPNNQKDIFICTYDVNDTDNTYKTKVLNSKGETVFGGYESVEAVDNYDSKGNIWYEGEVLRVKKDGKYGLINYKGETILPTQYDEITTLKGVKNSIIITKEGKAGLCNSLGEVIIEPVYSQVLKYSDEYQDGYVVTTAEGKYGLMSSNKAVLLDPIYEGIAYVGSKEYYGVKSEGKNSILDKDKNVVFTGDYDSIVNISGDNIVVKKANKYGIVDKAGNKKVDLIYDDLRYAFSDNYIAKKDNKYGIINSGNEQKLEIKYANVNYNNSGSFIQADVDDIESILLNTNFEQKVSGIVSEINETKGYIRVRIGQDYKYYNFKLEEKKNTEVLTGNTLFLNKENGKYGYINKDGEKVVDYIYDDALEQNIYGYCAVQQNGTWGSINNIGNIEQETNVNLDNNTEINFIGKWHLSDVGKYYTK